MPKGLADLQATASEGGGGGSYVRNLKLANDGEFATIRFLSGEDDIFYEKFHRNMVNGEFKGYKICAKKAFGQRCEKCENEDWPSTLFLAWVYEFDHFYPEPVKESEQVTFGKKTMYKVTVNQVKLMQYSGAHRHALVEAAEEAGETDKHLTDFVYRWRRSGKKGDTRPAYTLKQIEETKLSPELIELRDTLPDLEEVAAGRTERLDGQATEGKKEYAVREVAKVDAMDDDEDAPAWGSDDDDEDPF